MTKLLLCVLFSSIYFSGGAQDLFRLQLDSYQTMENGISQNDIQIPNSDAFVIMGGLNDLDGANNYFNLFGSKLIIDSHDRGLDGIQKVVLRREDGRNFLNLYPTITARLIPIVHPKNEKMLVTYLDTDQEQPISKEPAAN